MFQIQPLEPLQPLQSWPTEVMQLSGRELSVSRLSTLMGQMAAMPHSAVASLDQNRTEPCLHVDPITWIEYPNDRYRVYQYVDGAKAVIFETADASQASNFLQHYFSAITLERNKAKSPSLSVTPPSLPTLPRQRLQHYLTSTSGLSGLIMQWLGAVSLGLLGVLALAWALGRVQFS